MRQIVQSARDGKLETLDIPMPAVRPGYVLIANHFSLLSAGTERFVRDLARKSLLGKARERPDHVRRVLEKARTEGLWRTIKQVQEKLDDPMPMGYSSAGVVLACGDGVQEFKVGDRVASNGPHAEVVAVPKQLCAHVPDKVPLDHASFTVLGAVAMQGIRLARTTLGETVFVVGLGLVGQLTVLLLKAAGARVIGADLDPDKCELARKLGADIARPGLSAAEVQTHTRGLGADAVLITASTASDGPVRLAGDAVRQKGRVVAVGTVGMNLPRPPFFRKETEFVVSCSYGPGRYDPTYEEGGRDYPAAYVRWTEQRNLQSVLDLMETGAVDVSPLISHRFELDQAHRAYALLEDKSVSSLGVMLSYPQDAPNVTARSVQLTTPTSNGAVGLGCLGAGNFARNVLLPAFCAQPEVRPELLCSVGGKSAVHCGRKLGFSTATTDEQAVYENAGVDAVVIATQHNQHARQVLSALSSGKHVFVEKPLCLQVHQLLEIEAALADAEQSATLMVGFNRRFSEPARAVKKFFASVADPKTVSIRFNAGSIPADHWTQDSEIGGGRIIGEACHAIDLATYLVGAPPVRVFAESVGGEEITDDQCFITLRHADGSISNVAYLAGGDRAFPKERVELIGGGQVAVIDDFRSAVGYSGGKQKRLYRGKQDKGHEQEVRAFVDSLVHGKPAPIEWSEIFATTLASLLAVQSLREGVPLQLAAATVEQVPHRKAG